MKGIFLSRHSIRLARVKSLAYSIYDGFFYSCMIGFGETYFSAFAVFLGANNFQMGLLTSVPPFIAGISQFKTVILMKKMPSRRKLVATGVAIQALSLVPLALSYNYGVLRIEIYITLVTLYFTANAVIGPVWNSWMGDLVSVSQRGIYFGKRNRVVTIGTFVTMTLAGYALRYFEEQGWQLGGFYFIFALAFLTRTWSFYFLTKKYDPPAAQPKIPQEGFSKFVQGLHKRNHGILILYMAAVNFAVFVAAAYYTPLLLREFHYDYLTYTLVIGGAALTRFISSNFWGEIVDKLGARKVVTSCGFLTSFTTLPWLFTHSPLALFLAQCYTGFVWAGYELSNFTFLLDATAPEELASLSSYLNVITSSAGFLGGLVGALMFASTKDVMASYNLVFVLTIVLRVIAFIVFGRRLKEVRVIAPVKTADVFIKATGFKSAVGLTSRLVIFARRRKSA